MFPKSSSTLLTQLALCIHFLSDKSSVAGYVVRRYPHFWWELAASPSIVGSTFIGFIAIRVELYSHLRWFQPILSLLHKPSFWSHPNLLMIVLDFYGEVHCQGTRCLPMERSRCCGVVPKWIERDTQRTGGIAMRLKIVAGKKAPKEIYMLYPAFVKRLAMC